MVEWVDVFTQRRYRFTEEGLRKARRHVAELLAKALRGKTGVREMADAAATFWAREYYEFVFPLGFGKVTEGEVVRSTPLTVPEPVGGEVVFRSEPLDGTACPVILPAGGEAPSEALLADVILVRTALINLLLRQQGAAGTLLDALRLACLVAPLAAELRAHGVVLPPEVERLVAFLEGGGEPPGGVDAGLVRAVWEAAGSLAAAAALPDGLSVVLVLGAVQRVKQYVFETPGLNEIRGGSELLEEVTRDLREEVARELGAEVVLRAAGAHLEFLAPGERRDDGEAWVARVRRAFLEATGGVLVAAVARPVKVKDLLSDFGKASSRVFGELEAARSAVRPFVEEILPFEERCAICRRRAAEGWFRSPEGRMEPACRTCYTKREVGQQARRGKVEELAKLLAPCSDPWGLGGAARLPASLDDLVPQGARRRWVAVVYGDGNNFGAVGQRLRSIGEVLQWTRRVDCVTRSAAALALAEAVRESAGGRGEGEKTQKLPFQVLALGGEDLSLFAWGPVGLRFARHFVRLTDREFEPEEAASGKRVSFSLGVLVTDEKAAVQRTVRFTEEELLKWAKRAARKAGYQHGGTIAFLVVPSADQIPGHLEDYLEKMFFRQGRTLPVCLTLRPVTAAELGFLLEKAARLRAYYGHVERMAAAFVRGEPRVAVLYYLYQKSRARKTAGGPGFTEVLEDAAGAPATLEDLRYPAALLRGRLVLGGAVEVPEPGAFFSPLGDLVELVKALQ